MFRKLTILAAAAFLLVVHSATADRELSTHSKSSTSNKLTKKVKSFTLCMETADTLTPEDDEFYQVETGDLTYLFLCNSVSSLVFFTSHKGLSSIHAHRFLQNGQPSGDPVALKVTNIWGTMLDGYFNYILTGADDDTTYFDTYKPFSIFPASASSSRLEPKIQPAPRSMARSTTPFTTR